MKNRIIIKSIMILSIILLALSGGVKTYATTQNLNQYEIVKSEENSFLEDIYKTETDTRKIKNIEKEISKKNYLDKEIFKTKTLNKKDTEYIYKEFGKTQEFNDGEYKGTLPIVDVKVETIKNDYYEKIDEKVLDFKGYTDNDLKNIEKEIILNNTTYYLINVKWEADATQSIDGTEIPTTYKGTKIYQTIQKIANPNTYKITVKYLGQVEKIDTIYDYKVTYEDIKQIEEPKQEKQKVNVTPIIIISGIGLTVLLIGLLNRKNTYIYSKTNKGFKLIKREQLSDKNVVVDITDCINKNENNIYAMKVNAVAFKKLKGRTITIVLGSKKKDIILWNNYYEIKL